MAWSSRATRFCGRGREGEELNGSKAGNKDAGRFTPATGAAGPLLGGDDSMVMTRRTVLCQPQAQSRSPRMIGEGQRFQWKGRVRTEGRSQSLFYRDCTTSRGAKGRRKTRRGSRLREKSEHGDDLAKKEQGGWEEGTGATKKREEALTKGKKRVKDGGGGVWWNAYRSGASRPSSAEMHACQPETRSIGADEASTFTSRRLCVCLQKRVGTDRRTSRWW